MVYQDIVARLMPAETDAGDSSDDQLGAVMMCDDYQGRRGFDDYRTLELIMK